MAKHSVNENDYMSRVLRKLGIMHVRKVSSQISLCSPHRLIRTTLSTFMTFFVEMKSLLSKHP